MIENNKLDKWIYREHTRVKHILLRKYLRPWITILGKRYDRICYFDGFAGRGEYVGDVPGSPLAAIQTAENLLDYFGELVCVNIERNPNNFENLCSVLQEKLAGLRKINEHEFNYRDKIKIIVINGEFATVISGIVKEVGARLAPSFFFVDPFGFSGVPFDVIKDILSIPRTELFLTFMYRDMARFLRKDELGSHFVQMFGTEGCLGIANKMYGREREHALRNLYTEQLRKDAGVRFVFTFRVCMSKKVQTLYYLIHATNNFKGYRIMKEIMYKQASDFAYLGPEDSVGRKQLPLLKPADISLLKKLLLETFSGQTLGFEEIEEKICTGNPQNPYIEKHFRDALRELETEEKVKVERITSKKTGLTGNDRITFI